MESETTKPDFVCDRLYDKLVGLGSKTSAAIHNWRFKQAQRSLEHDLASIIETANSHRAKGLSNGSPAYVALREKAASMIESFCQRWNVNRSLVESEAPALKDLYALSESNKGNPAAFKLLACFLGGILSLVLIGAASGLVTAAHDWVVHALSH